MAKNKIKLKIFSILIGLVIGLLVAEVSLRIYKYTSFHNLDDIEFGNRVPIDRPNEELKLGQIIQIASHQKIIYELIPNSTYQFRDVAVQTNNRGFRDKNYPLKKDTSTYRIIGLGDSGMFGWGVTERSCYLTQLENQLNQSDSLHFEVINTGVPGYNTVMEVAVLENKFDLNQVDLVVIDFISNDFELPSFIRKKPKFWSLEKSFILLFFEENFLKKHKEKDKWLATAPKNEKGDFEDNPNKVPEEYHNLVGQKNYKIAMQRLKELSEKFGFQVLVLSQSPYLKIPEVVTETCRELNFDFVDFKPYWEKYQSKKPSAQWKISEHDWHPTAEGHREISKVLFEKIKSMLL